MVPSDYSTFFITMAGVGATLFGLIFVAVSIAPESFATEKATLDRQVKATAAYTALLNPLIISLFALVPHLQIGIAVIAASLISLANTFALTLSLLQNAEQRYERVRHSLFILAGFTLYGYEVYFAVRLLQFPQEIFGFFGLANMLIIIYIFGVIRAWELIGIRQFRVKNWVDAFKADKQYGNKENQSPANSPADTKKGEN
ncbi:MAG TPA: hypothetical protein VKF38_02915 [Anaerolineaceae bacterium]|nr:hypothetical protein [Anaerolineaceae bacterium]